MVRRIFLAFIVFLGFASASLAQDARLAGVVEEIERGRAGMQVPGMAIAVVENDRVVFLEGFGTLGLGRSERVTPDTRFGIASCSKAFTAFGVGLMVDEGKMRFDDLVRVHEPGLVLPQVGASDLLTIRHLLSQRSGFARHDFLWHARPEMTRKAFVTALANLPMQGVPGAEFGYTNNGIILAGHLIEDVTGKSWEDFTRERIFTPLGMTRSNFSSAGLAGDADAAIATKRRDGANRTVPWRDGRLLGPAGSINSTARDMAQWLRVHLSGGEIDGKRILSAATLSELWRAEIIQTAARPGSENSDLLYAMGWRVDNWRGQRRVSHTGAVDGFRARVTMFPDLKLGIVVLSNLGPTMAPDYATRTLAERMMNLPRNPWMDTGTEGLRRGEAEAAQPRGRVARMGAFGADEAPPSKPAENFAGTYRHPSYGDIRIVKQPDGTLAIGFGTLAGKLDHWRSDGYIAHSNPPDDTLDEVEISFVSDFDGRLTHLTAMIDNDIDPVRFDRQPDGTWLSPGLASDWTGIYGRGPRSWRIDADGGRLIVTPPGERAVPLQPDLERGWLVWGPLLDPTGRLRVRNRNLEVLDDEGMIRLPRQPATRPAPSR
jgi:CubicO group peptidase (beta-lactamase class C family)